jgi:hypothetical protein
MKLLIDRYKAYVAWCGALGIVPAFFSVWQREVAKVPERF